MARALGPLLTEWPLKQEAARIVRRYTGIYSDEVARQQAALGHPVAGVGPGDRVKRVRSVLVREATVRLPEEQQPAILISAPGTVEVADRDGAGGYAAVYPLIVASYVVASDPQVGGDLAAVLALAATKALLVGLPGRLDGRVGQVRWQGKSDSELPPDGDRSRHSSVHRLDVVLLNVLSDTGPLPDLPPDDELTDPGDLPVVEDTDATAEPVEEITR